MTKKPITADDVAELKNKFEYQAETGLLIHKVGRKAGSQAGSAGRDGYVKVFFRGGIYCAHRVAWSIYYGEEPHGEIDHKNGDRSDNRISNLRVVDRVENMQNLFYKPRGFSGVRGVVWSKKLGKWRARITVDKKGISLGCFESKDEAHRRYLLAKENFHLRQE